MEKYKIATEGGLVEIEAEPVTIAGEKCFIHEEDYTYRSVSHCETGMHIAEGRGKRAAIAEAKKRLIEHPDAIERGREECRKRGFKLPINQ